LYKYVFYYIDFLEITKGFGTFPSSLSSRERGGVRVLKGEIEVLSYINLLFHFPLEKIS
jgi:hypothetical protein